MEINELYKRLKANVIEENTAETVTDGIPMTVTVCVSNYFCSIAVSAKCSGNKQTKTILEQINNTQQTYRYCLNDDTLTVKVNMLVDKRPSLVGLKVLINEAMASLSCTKLLIEEGVADG